MDSKQWNKQKVTRLKKNVENETVGWIYFFFVNEIMYVEVCV